MAWEWTIQARDLGKLERALADGARTMQREALREAAQRTLELMRARTLAARPANPAGVGRGAAFDTGKLYRAWYLEKRPRSLAVGNRRIYSVNVEAGRRAGARPPPSDALREWVRRNLGVTPRRAKAVAYLVARAIGARGLRARNIVDGALPQVLDIHRAALQGAVDRAMKKAAKAR